MMLIFHCYTVAPEILQVLLKDRDYFRFDDVIVKIKELPNPEREMIKEVITLCKLILVNPPDLSNRTVRQSNPIEHQSFDCRTQSNIIELTIKFCQSNTIERSITERLVIERSINERRIA